MMASIDLLHKAYIYVLHCFADIFYATCEYPKVTDERLGISTPNGPLLNSTKNRSALES